MIYRDRTFELLVVCFEAPWAVVWGAFAWRLRTRERGLCYTAGHMWKSLLEMCATSTGRGGVGVIWGLKIFRGCLIEGCML